MENEIKKRIITNTMIIYYSKCPLCEKDIAGRGEKGYKYNLKRHMEDKHSKKEEISKEKELSK